MLSMIKEKQTHKIYVFEEFIHIHKTYRLAVKDN